MTKKYTDPFGIEFELDQRIKLNGSEYLTDKGTVKIFEIIMPRAIETGDFSAAIAALIFGEKAGIIVKA